MRRPSSPGVSYDPVDDILDVVSMYGDAGRSAYSITATVTLPPKKTGRVRPRRRHRVLNPVPAMTASTSFSLGVVLVTTSDALPASGAEVHVTRCDPSISSSLWPFSYIRVSAIRAFRSYLRFFTNSRMD